MASLRVLVVRYDDKIITEMSVDTFMEKLTKKYLDQLPDKRFGQDKRDEQAAVALRDAWLALRSDIFSVGFKLSTWVGE